MTDIRSICVYCGSSPGGDAAFLAAAREFGKVLATNRIRLVYGGGTRGLMGALASATVQYGGEVTGIIPEFLTAREHMFKEAHEMVVTRDMHERKRIMFERADAFVALPGGIGTLEETVEQLTWAQLGQHQKPILLANINHFWDPLCELFGHMKKLGFIHADLPFGFLTATQVDEILPTLRTAMTTTDRAREAQTAQRM